MRLFRSPIFLLFLILAVIAAGFSYFKFCPLSKPVPPVAFSKACWGMGFQEVQKSNQTTLTKNENLGRFYIPKRNGPESSRYTSYESNDSSFLGRQAKVRYLFLDDRLFAFHLFIQDADAEKLQADMEAYLDRQFGKQYLEGGDTSASLKRIWNLKDQIVNYWFFQESLSLSQKFSAGFGVVYRPIEESGASSSVR